jgi:hypothetical protein
VGEFDIASSCHTISRNCAIQPTCITERTTLAIVKDKSGFLTSNPPSSYLLRRLLRPAVTITSFG